LNDASQDRCTIFSPVYAFFIKLPGLQPAAIALLVCCTLCFYAAARESTRKLFDARTALPRTPLLIVVPLELLKKTKEFARASVGFFNSGLRPAAP
jgi:hypothetical protein